MHFLEYKLMSKLVYLNKSTMFKCGNNAIFKPLNFEPTIKISGDNAITTACKLQLVSPVPCPNTPNHTCACPVISGSWSNDSTIKTSSHKILVSSCSINCPFGGTLKPFGPSLTMSTVHSDAKCEDVNRDLNFGKEEQNSQKNTTDTSSSICCSTDNLTENSNRSNTVNLGNNNYSNDKAEPIQEQYESTPSDYCNYYNKNKEKCINCDYIATSHGHKAKNLPLFIRNLKNADQYNEDPKNISHVSIAAHHIVPVNECFNHPDFCLLRKLANYFEYDINCAGNGENLPTFAHQFSADSQQIFDIAMQVMEDTNRQWHSGGHELSFKDEDIRKINEDKDLGESIGRQITKFSSYSALLRSNLKPKVDALKDRCKCFCDLKEKDPSFMQNFMDRVADKIRKELIDANMIRNKDISSYYFVSKKAFYFAYRNIFKQYENNLKYYFGVKKSE